MKTTFSLLADRCGLSHREAAEFLAVRIDTAKSWSSGRNPAPAAAIAALRGLYAAIENAACNAVEQITSITKTNGTPEEIEIGLASDDYEARQPPLSWPCAGAHAAMIGIVAARIGIPVKIVARGATVASAAAADEHDKKYN